MKERRKHHRVSVDIPANIKPEFGQASRRKAMPCYIRNISLGGVLIGMDYIPEAMFFILQFQFPGETEPYRIRIQKAWSPGREADDQAAWHIGFGARFLDMDQGLSKRLAAGIEHYQQTAG